MASSRRRNAEKGLLREVYLALDSVLLDPNTNRRHHFIDEDTGRICDILWNHVEVSSEKTLPDFEVNHYQVVMRGQCRHAEGDFFSLDARQRPNHRLRQ